MRAANFSRLMAELIAARPWLTVRNPTIEDR
jgi:hypothetical protein